MKKWVGRAIVALIIGGVALGIFDSYRGGFFNLPKIPSGAYPISFKNGFRGIVFDLEVSDSSHADTSKFFRRLQHANPERKYLGIPMVVPAWFEDAWSHCAAANADDVVYYAENLPKSHQKKLLGARLDAVCTLDSDGKEILRGLIYSVPKL